MNQQAAIDYLDRCAAEGRDAYEAGARFRLRGYPLSACPYAFSEVSNALLIRWEYGWWDTDRALQPVLATSGIRALRRPGGRLPREMFPDLDAEIAIARRRLAAQRAAATRAAHRVART